MNRKRILIANILLLFLFASIHLQAQNKDTAQASAALPRKDYLLVVPFMPQMYNATGDQFICKTSRMTAGEVSDQIRRSLSSTLQYNLSEHYNVKELIKNNLQDQNSDLSVMYQVTKFSNVKKKLRGYYKGYPPRKMKKWFSPRHVKWGSDCVNDKAEKPSKKRHNFVKATIIRDSIFESICNRNSAGFVLYITQFEMSTRFKSCLDLQSNVYQRDIFIHFCLFKSDGKYVTGGVVGTTFQSSSNDVNTIIEKNLGLLSGMIIDVVRTKI
jgi:hypothetical protein